jgi:uncharacterized SAM-binding protein YcdF (DUF218 family)
VRGSRVVALAALAVVALACALTARYVVWPSTDGPRRADGLVVLAGGGGERLAEARRLMAGGVAPVLVVSHGRQPGWAEANRLCNGGAPYEVVCIDPIPDRTQGEARAVGRLARERGWSSLVVVTSRYHVHRATMLVRRCFGGDVSGVGARPDSPGGLPSLRNLVREWAGYGHALVLERDC